MESHKSQKFMGSYPSPDKGLFSHEISIKVPLNGCFFIKLLHKVAENAEMSQAILSHITEAQLRKALVDR